MQIHEIQPKNRSKNKKRIGRGGKRGTYSGKGIKGQSSRAGRKMPPAVRDLVKRYPKLRGYDFHPFRKVVSINLKDIENNFKDGEEVSYALLVERKVIKQKSPSVKILGDGEISKAVNISGCMISKSAKEKIEKAGGKIIEKNG